MAKVLAFSARNNYKPHEAKRKLCDSYDMFMADDRIIPILPKLLGKSFFKKRPARPRRPHQARLARADPESRRRHLRAHGRRAPPSASRSVKLHQSVDEITENAIAAIANLVEIIPRKWANVQGVYLKANESVALRVQRSA